MNQKRREFLSYISILGVAGLTASTPLGALTFSAAEEGVYVDQSHVHDDAFDPDGWL
jgi:hypothetical protein